MSERAHGPELTGELCCRGWVMHNRTHPVKHQFTYRVWMLLVDLDASARPWPRWLASWDRGHLLSRSKIELALHSAGIDVRPARIFALTQPRSAGFSFNPLNFYFCYGDSGCQAILSDVRNTPWNQKHCYVLDARGQHGEYAFQPRKELHVSPFLPMQGDYRWRIRLNAERIEVIMHFAPHGRPAFMATLSLGAEPLTKRAVLRTLMCSPAQNLATLMRIRTVQREVRVKRMSGAPFGDDR
ncbi:MAG: DUF1365 domain-containing protein, partial [Gammaproteobacteria bacterium]|nr:DUF1365 domain-containing protein [Gammaproteobacteria bacterium]